MYCYKGFKGYQPLNVYWYERDVMVNTEFRAGNYPANKELLRMFKESLAMLPEGVQQVYYRGDGASYNHDLLKYLDSNERTDTAGRRFGRIGFAVRSIMSPELKRVISHDEDAVWKDLDVDGSGNPHPWGRQWAEVCFVPNALAMSKKGREYRYLVTRQLLEERCLPGLEEQLELPFPTVEMNGKRYKVFAIATNLSWDGAEIIRWHDGRAGRSEAAHSILKSDLGGGKMPSGKFGANGAWWWLAVLPMNVQAIMQHVGLGGEWRYKRMKAARFHLINLPARLVRHANSLMIKLSIEEKRYNWILSIRRRILAFARGPCVT